MLPLIFLVIVLMSLSFLFSGSETIFFSLAERDIEKLSSKRHPASKILKHLSKRRNAFLSSLLFFNTTVNIAFVAISNLLFEKAGLGESLSAPLKVIVITLVLLMFCEITPKALALTNKRLFIYILFPAFFFFQLFRPFAFIIGRISGGKRLSSKKERGGIKEVLTYLKENETHVKDEVEFLEKYGELKNRGIMEIAVPREGIVYLKNTATAEQASLLFKKYRLSRVPVAVNDVDNIVGIFYIKDIIELGKEEMIEKRMRKAHKIDFRAQVFKVMNYFLKNKTHIAVIVDSMGKTMGIVTLQDIVDDIVKPLEGD